MIALFVDTVEMLGPGVRDWAQGAALLRTPCDDELGDLPSGEPSMLAPNERRRTTTAIRLALRVTEQLAARAP
ncbi:MAG: 3-oxoacyl-ACP synthase, partial [Burkholderiales bacterium]|nr:3-oxoacyl-ACP synthase [Burkholderiales bacterium]